MQKKIKILLSVITVICVILVGIFITVSNSAKKVADGISIQSMDITGVPDGVYEGNYEISPVEVSVHVTVKDEKIIDITILEHRNGIGGKAESIVQDVIDNQSLDVDTVSGATVSSKAILKAIENALGDGRSIN